MRPVRLSVILQADRYAADAVELRPLLRDIGFVDR